MLIVSHRIDSRKTDVARNPADDAWPHFNLKYATTVYATAALILVTVRESNYGSSLNHLCASSEFRECSVPAHNYVTYSREHRGE